MAIKTILGASNTDITTVQGSRLDDIFIIEESNLYISGLEGGDTISGTSGVEQLNIDSGDEDDRLIFNAEVLNSTFSLGLGNDGAEIQDFSGTINGGMGRDSISASSNRTITESLIRGQAGDDVFNFANIASTIVNTNSDDDYIAISGKTISSELYGGRQKDTINVTKAIDSLIRGDANEDKITISGDLTNTIINGNADNDLIIVNSNRIQSSTVYGGQGDDNIDITSDAIYVAGGKGDDDIDLTSSKNHTIYGGTGNDEINSNSTKALLIDAGANEDTSTLTGIASGSTVHSIDGGAGKDL